MLAYSLPVEAIRKELLEKFPPTRTVPTSADLPLSDESKRALGFAAKEADRLHSKEIEPAHLLLGLLRVKTCLAAELLRQHGVSLHSVRRMMSERPAMRHTTVSPPPDHPTLQPVAPALKDFVHKLQGLIYGAEGQLQNFAETDAERRLAHKPWSRKEAMGHLIDWATTHHQWFARALTEPKLVAPGYPGDDWVTSQHYGTCSWHSLVQLWTSINLFLVYVMLKIPEEKLNIPCRIGIEPTMPLSQLIDTYVNYCEDLLAQILTHR